jgi:trehalose 6-phosphate phosphatase
VAIVSGRTKEQIQRLLPATKVAVFGLYGLEEESQPPMSQALRRDAEAVAATVAGAWVEDKGPSVAVHYRSSPNPDEAERVLRGALSELAVAHARALLLGKMVLELAPASTPGKGAVVLRETLARGLVACLFAGDDVADLEGFGALDQLREGGTHTMKVAVRSLEAPSALLDAADLVVDGPRGLAEVLRRL